MRDNNPFHTPDARVETHPEVLTGSVPEVIIDHLRQTRPWLILFAVLGVLWTGLGLLGGGTMAVLALFAENSSANMSGAATAMPIMIVAYLAFAVGAAFPTYFLIKQAMAIGRLVYLRSMNALEHAIDLNRKFWFACSILVFIGILLYAAMFAAMFAGYMQRSS